MSEITIKRLEDVPGARHGEHEGYEYLQRAIVPRGSAKQCAVSVYEVPPGKAAYPYHYHIKNEEVYYILSGSGTLKTPAGEKAVSRGDFLFFPACAGGAHKLANHSKTEPLVYIDFDTVNDLEAVVYPDSDKIGVGGGGMPYRLFRSDTSVDYYDGE